MTSDCWCLCGANEIKCGSNEVLVSPNYPNNYQNYIQCSHQISVEPGHYITIEYESFSVSTSNFLIHFD